MKKYIIKLSVLGLLSVLSVSCNRFDEINTNPVAASSEQVQPEYFLNNSIIGAQQDPHIAERVFVIYWKNAGHHQLGTGLSGGNADDGYSSDYWRYISGWLNNAATAISVGQEKAANGTAKTTNNNVIQAARIWRAYLLSEMADNFGSVPVEAFQGVNPKFNSQQEVYYFILDELKDAVAKMDTSVTVDDATKRQDAAFGFNWSKWISYGNSMRMRMAMRIAEVDPAKAKTEFEAAASGKFISTAAENFKVAERPGWDPLTGVMSREWNLQWLSVTYNNIAIGLGGISSTEQVGEKLKPSVKAEDYIGMYYPDQFATKTNDPSAGYWLDGLPNKIDPRAYKTFYIPGDFENPVFSNYPSYTSDAKNVNGTLKKPDGTVIPVDVTYTWNAFTGGNWGPKAALNQLRGIPGKAPALAQQYRTSTNHRIFFASWESYFLIAEAALKGWKTPMSDEDAYNKGIAESFAYHGVSAHYAKYVESTDYSRTGTSVKYSHTAEPGSSHTMKFIDGYTKAEGTVDIKYPVNNIYKNGAVRNDKLTKIITQKYLANVPWLPLEAWSDHRRLGLPFFENPALETPLPNLPALTSSNFMTNSIKMFPQRLKYPSTFRNSDPNGYNQAVGFLNGPDDVFTPLWWAKKQ